MYYYWSFSMQYPVCMLCGCFECIYCILLAGRLFSTFFGGHSQQQRGPSADTRPHDSSEGSQGHAPASTDEQQLTGAESQQPISSGQESGNVPEEGVHTSNQQSQDEDDVDVQQAMQPQSGMHPP